jgi:hypothetical protein
MATDREQLRRNDKGRITNVKDISDAEGAANKLHQRVHRFAIGTDAATSTARTCGFSWTSHAIRIVAANLLVETATASNATNFATIKLSWNDGAGGSNTDIAVAGTSGTTFTAAYKIPMTITAASAEVAISKQLLCVTSKSGAGGVVLGACVLEVVYQEI